MRTKRRNQKKQGRKRERVSSAFLTGKKKRKIGKNKRKANDSSTKRKKGEKESICGRENLSKKKQKSKERSRMRRKRKREKEREKERESWPVANTFA